MTYRKMKKILEEQYHMTYDIYVNFKAYTWQFRTGCTIASMDHVDRYKRVDYLVQSSLLSSLV